MSRGDDVMTQADARSLLGQIREDLDKAEERRAFALGRLQYRLKEFVEVLPISQVAELTGLSRPTIYKMLSES